MRFKPRFSLRTLFVLITIAGCWIGYQLNWIRERHEFLAKGFNSFPDFPESLREYHCPWSLWLFGEQAKNYLCVDKSRENEAKDLFPEARVTTENSMTAGTECR